MANRWHAVSIPSLRALFLTFMYLLSSCSSQDGSGDFSPQAHFHEREVKWNPGVKPNRALFNWGGVYADPEVEGWIRSHSDPNVVSLRDQLSIANCMPGLEIVSSHEVDFSTRAAELFERDGFVVIGDALTQEQWLSLRDASDQILLRIFEEDPAGGAGGAFGRLPYRYSLGDCSATRQNLHLKEYLDLVDLPTTTPLLRAIFGSDDYALGGCGGDVALAGAIEYQHLHMDTIWGAFPGSIQSMPVPVVTVNFVVQNLTAINGPTRQVAGSHRFYEQPPLLADEPDWMKLSTLCPIPAGSAIFRDNRAWHAGTPNLSEHRRTLPNLEFFAPWIKDAVNFPGYFNRTPPASGLAHKLWRHLSAHAQHVTRDIVWPSGTRIPNEGLYSPLPVYHDMR